MSRHFEGIYHLHLQGRKSAEEETSESGWLVRILPVFTSMLFVRSDDFGDRHREMCRIILKEIRCEEDDWINLA
jgi:hypothetical protein